MANIKNVVKTMLKRNSQIYFFVEYLYSRCQSIIKKSYTDQEFIEREIEASIGWKLNLCEPHTLIEKLNWIRLYGDIEPYHIYVDKYLVRNFIKEQIGDQYLVPLIGTWRKASDIDFEKLPMQFVLKATHGSGYNIVCTNKTEHDIKYTKMKLDLWLKENYATLKKERQYELCEPRIICETYIQDFSSKELYDYKFYCFHGNPVYCQVIGERDTEQKVDFYDTQWNRMSFKGRHLPMESFPNFPEPLPKPDAYEEMIQLARKLSERFAFVRVDLYYVNKKIYFSELTFIPANAKGTFEPKEWNYTLGEMLDLSKYPRIQQSQ